MASLLLLITSFHLRHPPLGLLIKTAFGPNALATLFAYLLIFFAEAADQLINLNCQEQRFRGSFSSLVLQVDCQMDLNVGIRSSLFGACC